MTFNAIDFTVQSINKRIRSLQKMEAQFLREIKRINNPNAEITEIYTSNAQLLREQINSFPVKRTQLRLVINK